MFSRVERDVCQYFGQQEFFLRFGRWTQWSNFAPALADVFDLVLRIRMIIALCHISCLHIYISVLLRFMIDDVSEIADGTMSEFSEVEGAHPVWSDDSGRLGQSDRFPCVGGRERRRSC